MTTETISLTDIERLLKARLGKYKDNPKWEDAIQEGVIKAWREIEGGLEEFWHVFNKAKLQARNYMFSDKRLAFGGYHRSTEGKEFRGGTANREKVLSYREEYINLHGRKPTVKQVSEATGLSTTVVHHYMRKARDGRYNNMAQYKDGRLDRDAYTYASIDGTIRMSYANDAEHWIDSYYSVPDFTPGIVDNRSFIETLSKLSERAGKVLYLHYCEDYTVAEIGKYLGYPRHHNANGSKALINARKEYKDFLLPPEEQAEYCKNGHLRTPENTAMTAHNRRNCLTCAEIRRQAIAKKNVGKADPRKEVDVCKRGHPFSGDNLYVRKNGMRMCKQCNYEGAVRRNEAKKAKK